MENIKLIQERIKSCLSCDEERCPAIQERYYNHVMSHHTSHRKNKSTVSLQASASKNISSEKYTSTINLNKGETDDKEKLRKEIIDWTKDLPVYRNSFEDIKQNIINEIIENISTLDVNEENYNEILEREVNKYLDNLPVHEEQRHYLKQSLIGRILHLNKKLRVTPNNNSVLHQHQNTNNNKKVKDITTNITKTIDNENRDRTNSDELDTFDVNIDKYNPQNSSNTKIMKSKAQYKEYKSKDKPLEELSFNNLNMVIAEDNNEQVYYSKTSIGRDIQGPTVDQRYDFTYHIQTIVRNELNNMGIYNNDIINQIVFLFEDLPCGTDGNLESITFELLKRSSNLPDRIIIKIIISIIDKILFWDTNARPNIFNQSLLLDSVSVYRSKQDLHNPVAVPVAQKSKTDLKQIKKNEKEFKKNIGIEIKSWINTLTRATKGLYNKNIKDNTINILVNDLIDQVKINQKAPDPNANREKCMYFFIMRWLNKIDYFKDLNDAKPFVLALIETLVNIPVPRLIIVKDDIEYIKRIPRSATSSTSTSEKIGNKDFRNKKYSCKEPCSQALPKCENVECASNLKVNKRLNDPKTVIVDAVENWCYNLPVEGENSYATQIITQNVARDLYQKICELNMNSDSLNDDNVYREQLAQEIDIQLSKLPKNKKLQNIKDTLKEQLEDIIMKNKNIIKEKSSGEKYKIDLEKTIELSACSSNDSIFEKERAVFKIYKDRLAAIFILENYDHSDDQIKNKYVNTLRNDLEKYLQMIHKVNNGPIVNDSMYNKIHDELLNVSIPNELSLSDKVEEIKTTCEIRIWLDTLPLRKIKEFKELVERDKIVEVLAKRIHKMEKYDQVNYESMDNEIMKWIRKLPFLSDQENNVKKCIFDLKSRLKSTVNIRKCNPQNLAKVSEEEENQVNINKSAHDANDSYLNKSLKVQEASSLPACCQRSLHIPKKPTEIIQQIVNNWCKQLPLPASSQQEEVYMNHIKDNLAIKILMKINELNMNPETFNDDDLYDDLLDCELNTALSNLPTCIELIQSKDERIRQLKAAIKSIKLLINEETVRYQYKQQLKQITDKVLKESVEQKPHKSLLFITLRDELVDQYIEYSFDDDVEGKNQHKTIIEDTISKYCNKGNGNNNKPVIKANELIYELSKVPVPEKSIIDEEVKEIHLKSEITNLLDNLDIPLHKTSLKNQVKYTLTKHLSAIQKQGYTFEVLLRIKNEIIQHLRKLDENVDNVIVDTFIERLIDNEMNRSAISNINKSHRDTNYLKQRTNYQEPPPYHSKPYENDTLNNTEVSKKDQQWYSPPPATFVDDTIVNEPEHVTKKEGEGRYEFSLHSDNEDNDFNYKDFEKGVERRSSIIRNNSTTKHKGNATQTSSKQDIRQENLKDRGIQKGEAYKFADTKFTKDQNSSFNIESPRKEPYRREATSSPTSTRENSLNLTNRVNKSSGNSTSYRPQISNQNFSKADPSFSGNSASQNLKYPGHKKSYRKPSITFISPPSSSTEINKFINRQNYQKPKKTLNSDDEDECLCNIKRMQRQNEQMHTFCKICNGYKPYCNGPPFRYPGFYYY